jgi:hypothetical protein
MQFGCDGGVSLAEPAPFPAFGGTSPVKRGKK